VSAAQCRETLAGLPERRQRRDPEACSAATGQTRCPASSCAGHRRCARLCTAGRRAASSTSKDHNGARAGEACCRAAARSPTSQATGQARTDTCRRTSRRAADRCAVAGAAERDPLRLPGRLHGCLPRRAAGRRRGARLPAARTEAVGGLRHRACRHVERRTDVASQHADRRAAAPDRSDPARNPRSDDESVKATPRPPYRPAASLQIARSARRP
jgi:hypothetical protein